MQMMEDELDEQDEQDERMVLTPQDQENLLRHLEGGEEKQIDESKRVFGEEVIEILEDLFKKQQLTPD